MNNNQHVQLPYTRGVILWDTRNSGLGTGACKCMLMEKHNAPNCIDQDKPGSLDCSFEAPDSQATRARESAEQKPPPCISKFMAEAHRNDSACDKAGDPSSPLGVDFGERHSTRHEEQHDLVSLDIWT